MIPYRNILFPTDFSEACTAMVPSVKAIATKLDARVTVLHAFDLVRDYPLAPDFEVTGNFEPLSIPYSASLQQLRDGRKMRLAEFARTQFKDIPHSVSIEDRDPALVIEWAAERFNADLIMIPTRGLGKFRRLLLGSVTAKVLHDIKRPILTSARGSSAPQSTLSDGIHTILFAVSLRVESEEVFRTAGYLSHLYGAKICLLHIEPDLSKNRMPPNLPEITNLYERAVNSSDLRAENHPTALIMNAGIPDGVSQATVEEGTDLAIVGRGHSQETISQVWSHLYAIIRESPCPVLSV